MLKMARRVCFVTILLALLLALCGCEYTCKHEWIRSTCQAPRTCKLCGLTEGKVRAHEWGNTSCSAPEGCIYCGTTEGMELTHNWREDCRICADCGLDERPADVRFLEKLVAGLEARWQLTAAVEERENTELTKEDWTQFFQAEYDQIGTFGGEVFEDEALGVAAKRYVHSIEMSIEALEFFGTEQWEDAYYSKAYHEQMASLYTIHSLHPLTVDEMWQKDFDYMLVIGEVINMAIPLIDQVMFLLVQTDGDEKKYETTIRNTSSQHYVWFSFEIDLLDAQGNVIATETARVDWWKPDQRVRFNFTTTEDFSAMDVRLAQWELPFGFWE